MPQVKTDSAGERRARAVFSYLDGDACAKERRAIQAMIGTDPALAEDLEVCRELFAKLDGLRTLPPSDDFRARVLAAVHTPVPWYSRLRNLLGVVDPGVRANPYAALLDGSLPARQAKSLAALCARDPDASEAQEGWRNLFVQLGSLNHLAPAAGFADRVMARVPVQPSAPPLWERVTFRLLRAWPRHRHRWAAACGVAFGPVASIVGTAYVLASALWLGGNPMATASNSAVYLWAASTEMLGSLARAGWSAAATTPATGGVIEVVQTAVASGPALAAAVLAFTVLAPLSAWVLYRQVLRTPPLERRYVRA